MARLKKNDTPWVRRNMDYYATTPSLYWYLWVMLFFYVGLVIFVYIGVLIQNTSILYTYFLNPGAPGTLTSLRYNFTAIMLLLSVIVNFCFPLFIMFAIIYRYDHGCSVLWVVFFVILIGLQVLIIAGLGDQYSTCNQNGQFGNLCNDLEYCCVYYTDPVNQCPNTIACTPAKTASELAPNSDFLALFWFNFVFLFVFQLPYMIVTFVYWFSDNGEKTAEFVEQDEREAGDYVKPIVVTSKAKKSSSSSSRDVATNNAVGHGLKKRTGIIKEKI